MITPQPERLHLLDFFKKISSDKFVIPVYQRKYVWQVKKQIKKFLDDYFNLLNKPKQQHFIGIIIYLQIPKSIGYSELSIVDGQQRIITIFLIFEALIQLSKENYEELLENEISQNYLIKLQLLFGDNEIYEKILNNKFDEIAKNEETTSIYENFKYIKKVLKEKYQKNSLRNMLDILNNFYFVAIPLAQEDNLQEIFESINSTGCELTKADLIKNFLLMNHENQKQQFLYTNFWLPLEEMYPDSNKLEEFFRIFLANQTFKLSNIEDVYDDFKSWCINSLKQMPIEDIMKNILHYAKLYWNLFINDKIDIDNKVNKSLIEFRKNFIKEVAPFFIEIYKLFETKKDGKRLIDAQSFQKIIDLFITYNIRRNILNLPTGVLGRMIPTILKNVIDNCSLTSYDNVYNLTVKFLVENNKNNDQFMPNDEYIRSNLSNMNVYDSKKYLKTIFEKIESKNNPAVVVFDNLTIEHLMPQTPTKDWLEHLNITEETYHSHLHRLGNLTLATSIDNSKMSNKLFDYKKEILKNTLHLKINNEIFNIQNWTIEEIDKRTKKLIEELIELCPYPKFNKNDKQYYNIFLNLGTAKIRAKIYADYKVEILENSYFVHSMDNDINELIRIGVLKQKSKDNFIFYNNYCFDDLKKATLFLLEENELNEWELWTDSNNEPLNLKVRIYLKNKS